MGRPSRASRWRWRARELSKSLLRKARLYGFAQWAWQRARRINYNNTTSSRSLVNLDAVEPRRATPGRIAVHLHLFYPDLAAEFAGYFRNMPFAYDLFVSVPNDDVRDTCSRALAALPHCEKLKIEVVPNRGRDMAPMLCTFGRELAGYDFIAHLHGKKSIYNNGATLGWREYLCSLLFGSERRLRQIFTLLSGSHPVGIVYPQTYSSMPPWAHTWLANRHEGAAWCRRLGIDPIPRGFFDYPVGSMFWARGDALRSLFTAGITLEDFPPEAGQLDGTLAHCLERMLVLAARQRGFRHAVIEDTDVRNWSPWRLDHYFRRTLAEIETRFADPALRVVAFDIFDTLLCRPLLDPEGTKEIVAARAGDRLGDAYRRHRAAAEDAARQSAGRDVALDAIYEKFAERSGLPRQDCDALRQLEEEVERHSVVARPDGIALMQAACRAGKRVVLASDMFLPKTFLESLLAENGIADWDHFYLSNDVGLRKDTGALYRHILEREGLSPGEMMMIGDSERSDIQIPCDIGIPGYHLLRPIEAARAVPRLCPLVERLERGCDLNDQLTMGLVLRRAFSPVFYEGFEPGSLLPATPFGLGYAVTGPLTLGFAHWLARESQRDGIDRLYFLAREGESLRLVYDRWNAAFGEGPGSEYLVLSRRSTTVPAVASERDILNIGGTHYAPNAARSFLAERFGLELSDQRWRELSRQIGWHPEREVKIEEEGQIGRDVIELLRAVRPDIVAIAAAERPALMAYLEQIGLLGERRSAVVDVGYAATVQNAICRLVRRPIHGYYMMTIPQAHVAAERHQSLVRGCFFEGLQTDHTARAIYQNSFTLEKMLGSNDGQVIRYVLDGGGRVSGMHRPLSKSEQQGAAARTEIRNGMIAYVDDAIAVRKNVYPAFSPPIRLPQELFTAFVGNLSPAEKRVLETMTSDNWYCGRGVL